MNSYFKARGFAALVNGSIWIALLLGWVGWYGLLHGDWRVALSIFVPLLPAAAVMLVGPFLSALGKIIKLATRTKP